MRVIWGNFREVIREGLSEEVTLHWMAKNEATVDWMYPPRTTLKPNPQCEGIWKWYLWELIRTYMKLVPLGKRLQRHLWPPLPYEDIASSRRLWHRKWALTRHQICWRLDLSVPWPWTSQAPNKFLLFSGHLIHNILLWHPQWAETESNPRKISCRGITGQESSRHTPPGGLESGDKEKLGEQVRSERATRFWSHEGFVGHGKRFGFCSKHNDAYCDSRMHGTGAPPAAETDHFSLAPPSLCGLRKVSPHLWASVTHLWSRNGEFHRFILVFRLCGLKFRGSKVKRLRAWALG